MKKLIFVILISFNLGIFSCKTENITVPREPTKYINGSWKITAATRNGEDLIARFDFSKFRVNFTDSTYSIDSLVPFIVNKTGKWHFDDPVYPFSISFIQQDSASKTTPILYPVINGQRNIIMTLSPGCGLNSYQYSLQKAN